jgi:hypothetical protein
MADNKIFITTSKSNNTIGISGDNSQHFSNEARKSAEKSAQSAEEAKKYAEQTLSTKNDLLQNSDFIAVRNTLDEIVTVTDNLSIIETNAENIDAIKATSNNINNINTTVTNIAKIDTVASNVNTMNTVVTNITPIKNTANNITAINNVNTNIEAVKTNASNISDIKTNATNITDIKNTAKLVTTLDEKVDKSDMVPFEMVEVPTIIEVSDPSLMPSWYRVYSDGWCEQGGISPSAGDITNNTITLLKSYKDTNYSIFFAQNAGVEGQYTNGCTAKDKTTSSFVLSYRTGGTASFYWQTKGYIS